MKMESEEGLFNIVFKEDNAKELSNRLAALHVNKDNVYEYFQKLSSVGLNKLTKETDRIAEERVVLISQTQELAFQEYPTFIETAQCTQDIFQSFQKINQSTEKLTSHLTALKEQCVEFSKTAQSLNSARRLTSLALSKHTQLLEILELPQLMDTCVRNGYWEEALDLAAYVARLERRLAYIPLIVKVSQEVQSCTRLMLVQLIAQLKMPAQLPHCLKVVGYLKRMGVFSEEEIRLKFLQARDAWFKSTLEEIPKDDAYQHVLKTVELSRVHLFDIATQYRAIFTDEDPLVLANQDPNTNESALFYSWVIQKVTEFLLTLQSDLPKVSPSSLESVFGQCMYFGLSFGRIGSDFRALLVPLFAQIVYDRFDQAANKAEAQFADTMASFSLQVSRPGASSSHPAFTQSNTPADQVQPPYTLMKFEPVAELCNSFIAAFNELRLCAPIQLVQPVARKVELTLRACSQILADFQRQEKEAFTPSEEQEFARCLQLYRLDFLPHIQKIILLLFPTGLLSAQTGFPTTDIVKQEPGVLNKDLILQPIAHLLVSESSDEITSIAVENVDIVENNEVKPITKDVQVGKVDSVENNEEKPTSELVVPTASTEVVEAAPSEEDPVNDKAVDAEGILVGEPKSSQDIPTIANALDSLSLEVASAEATIFQESTNEQDAIPLEEEEAPQESTEQEPTNEEE